MGIPTITIETLAVAKMKELAETHEWVSVFCDRGWGDHGEVAEISIIVDGNGQKPIAYLSTEVYRSSVNRGLPQPGRLRHGRGEQSGHIQGAAPTRL